MPMPTRAICFPTMTQNHEANTTRVLCRLALPFSNPYTPPTPTLRPKGCGCGDRYHRRQHGPRVGSDIFSCHPPPRSRVEGTPDQLAAVYAGRSHQIPARCLTCTLNLFILTPVHPLSCIRVTPLHPLLSISMTQLHPLSCISDTSVQFNLTPQRHTPNMACTNRSTASTPL